MKQEDVSPEALAGLRDLLRTASSLPWRVEDRGLFSAEDEELLCATIEEDGRIVFNTDADLIVAAVNTFPLLLAEAEAAQKMRETLAQIKVMAEVERTGAWALGQWGRQRGWRDLLIVLERAAVAHAPGGQP